MNNSEFANSPNTTDFVIRANEYYINEIQNYPFVRITQVLSDYFILGYVDNSDIEKLSDILGTNFYTSLPYTMGLLDRSAMESSGIIQVQEQSFLELTGRGVLVGIIDTGIDYTLPIFQYEDGTSKIVSIFDQSIAGNPPQNFYVGSEFTNEQINVALKSRNPFDIVPSNDENGHGTFLASLVCGRGNGGNFVSASPDSELIIVKLKEASSFIRSNYLVPENNKNVYESTAVMLGIEYILQKARELSKPVAICLGVGTNNGPHDGNTLFEQYIGMAANITGVCICAAAGNESQERHHARINVIEGGSAKLSINNQTQGSGIYLSLFNSASDRISVSLKSPTGEIVSRIPAKVGTSYTTRLVLEKTKVTIQYYFPLSISSGQATIIKIENATQGLWEITAYGDIVLDGKIDAYLPLSSIGWQGVEFLEPDPYNTITLPATSTAVITCGAYNSIDNSLFVNSSWGPTRLPAQSPDLVSPGVRVLGYYPSGEGVMSGTSVSSAITTGACALMLQWGIVEGNAPTLDTFQIKGYLIRGCSRDSGISYPNYQWGYGKLDLYNTFNLLRDT